MVILAGREYGDGIILDSLELRSKFHGSSSSHRQLAPAHPITYPITLNYAISIMCLYPILSFRLLVLGIVDGARWEPIRNTNLIRCSGIFPTLRLKATPVVNT